MPKAPQRSYQVGNHTIYHGDCTKVEPGGLFHAILCDPPYELGFMGKKWDGSGIAFLPETWARLAEHLHPGGFLMAFASSRGWHRLACAIEDAGLRIHPSIFGWVNGSSFPKATRVDTQVDKAAGAEQKVIGPRVYAGGHVQNTHNGTRPIGTFTTIAGTTVDREPATDLAKAWAGHRYGGQILKNALEPIIVAQKPYAGKPVECITSTGAGALWIDGGRIGTRDCNESGWSKTGSKASNNLAMSGPNYAREAKDEKGLGRWPANFIIGDEEAAARLDAMSGVSESKSSERGKVEIFKKDNGWVGSSTQRGHNDSGGASRFFFRVQDQLDEADPVHYCPKASRRERDAGLEGMPVTVAHAAYGEFNGTDEHGPNTNGKQRNNHPTIKPTSLTKYLATLLLPPAEYAPRRLLVPFAGAGSEMIGAMQAGWEEIVGIEMEADYVELTRKRLEYWSKKEGVKPSKSVTQRGYQPCLWD